MSMDTTWPRNSPSSGDRYDPPCVEAILSSEELEREVLYAGFEVSGPD